MIKISRRWLGSFWGVIFASVLTSCGSPAPPEPPSLELPHVVTDLRATRKGDKVTLVWTVPTKTTDLQTVRHLGPTLICRSLQAAANKCWQVGQVPPSHLIPERAAARSKQTSAPVQITYVDTLPTTLEQQRPLSQASYAVETKNFNGRSSGLSNQVQIPLAPTPPAPQDVKVNVTGDGVVLTWTGALPESSSAEMRYFYRVYRRDAITKKDAIAGEVGLGDTTATLVDRSFEWQKTYEYRVSGVTVVHEGDSTVQVEGADSVAVPVTANDVFPPAVPVGLQAVASGVGQQPFIDLTWPPVSDADVAGYNIYRHEEGTPVAKINSDLFKTPAFRDTAVQTGHTYFYSVSAVDLRGNESGRSEETSEAIP